jgi:hypothetical protein
MLMASASASLHEGNLKPLTIDQHRVLVSIQEELEAVDWYNQRAKATSDPSLRAVLEHNRDEEKEHAVMTLEWLRRGDPVLDRHLRTYLFTEGDITEIEYEAEHEDGDATSESSLGIGSLLGRGSL